MTAAEDIRREYVNRHRAGQHSWQPGPLVRGMHPDVPASIMLVCGCGEVRRSPLPAITSRPRLVRSRKTVELIEQMILAWGPEREPGAARRLADIIIREVES